MIKTREQYEAIKARHDMPHTWETIEALREVPREINKILNWDVAEHHGQLPDWRPLKKALSALPEWLLEKND